MISKKEVKHIAKLARLELTEKEIEKMQKDLSAILDYFDLLKKAGGLDSRKAGGPEKLAGDEGQLRRDEVVSSHNIRDEIIAAAPCKKEDYIKVKAVF